MTQIRFSNKREKILLLLKPTGIIKKFLTEQCSSLLQKQEDKLIKALHNVPDLPLSEKFRQEEERQKLEQLKAEMQALQHIHS